MVCHQCGKPVEPGQHFCASCGASLRGVTDATARMPSAKSSPPPPPATEPTEEWAAHSPAWATTGSVPATATTGSDVSRSSLDSVPDLTGPNADADVWALTVGDLRRAATRRRHRSRANDRDAAVPDRHGDPGQAVPIRRRHAVRHPGRDRRPRRHVHDRGGDHQRHAPACRPIRRPPTSGPGRGCSTISPTTCRSRS